MGPSDDEDDAEDRGSRGGCAPLNATWPLGGLSVPAD